MGQWGNTDTVGNSVSWAASTLQAGSGKANVAANNDALYQNTTPDAFKSGLTVGQFGVSKVEMAVTSGEGKKVHAPGWALRRVGTGGAQSVTVVNGAGFVNGDLLLISGGQVNAVAVLTTNLTGNLVSASIVIPGRFPNTSVLVYTPYHETHLNATAGFTETDMGLGYDNTDYIVVTNSAATIAGHATIETLADGNISTITVTNRGSFANVTADGDAVVTIYAANGGTSNGSGAVLVANLVLSTGGTGSAGALGGRAGRVTYETLAVVKQITSGTSADDSLLPDA